MERQDQKDIQKEIIKKLPDTPGVYFFKSKSGSILYIGKATSLHDRVRSYFSNDIAMTRGPKIVRMLEEFHDVEYQQTDSVLEALLLEANLIKKYQPIYNTMAKDDKSFSYVVITKEKWPRVLLARGRDLEFGKTMNQVHVKEKHVPGSWFVDNKIAYSFGPFPNPGQLRDALIMVRKIFPYRDDKCIPCDEQIKKSSVIPGLTRNPRKIDSGSGAGMTTLCRPCFNRQIGLCPGVCTGEITEKEYKETIKNIVGFFRGNKKAVIKNLEKQMKGFAAEREFEKAAEVRGQIFALNHIHDVSLIKQENIEDKGALANTYASSTLEAQRKLTFRIEAYDVAHMSGKDVVGVMTVVENGTVQKAEYRKFKIKLEKNNDVGSLREMLRRRLNHDEWRLPNLIVVDGAAAQKNATEAVLLEYGYEIPVMAVTKNEYHKPKNILGERQFLVHEAGILLANAEAHRYGIAYHKKLRDRLR